MHFGVKDICLCLCEGDPFVKPNGDVYQCGFDDSPKVGDVFNGFKSMVNEDDEQWLCHKRYKKTKKD